MDSTPRRPTRRSALKTFAAATSPMILPTGVFGVAAPSNQITIGMVGMGRQARMRYADGVEVDYRIAEAPYLRFEGETGWNQSTWFPGGGLKAGLTASSDELRQTELGDDAIRIPRREDTEDFIYGIKTGEPAMADAEIGHRTCSMG